MGWRNALKMGFVILNLTSVLYANLRDRGQMSPLAWYGYVTGIDQVYNMFSVVHRSVRYFWYYGKTEDERSVLFPIELTPQRTWWQRGLVDHKAGKFHLNMASSDKRRRRYARFLCREWSSRLGESFVEVEIVEYSRAFPPLAEFTPADLAPPTDGYRLVKRETVECR